MNLDNLSLKELQGLKNEMYKNAQKNGSLSKMYTICEYLGTRLNHNYGPKYEFVDGDIKIYLDNYGGYMTVHKGDKLVCSTHNEKLFIGGVLEVFIEKWHPKAIEKKELENSERERKEKENLKNLLSI